MATAHTRWWFSSWRLGWDQYSAVFTPRTNLNNTSAGWKIRQKEKKKQKKIKALFTLQSETVTLNLKASNSTLFCCGCRAKSQAPWWFYCHCITFSATLLRGEGVGFLFWELLQLCVAGEEYGRRHSQTIPTCVWIKARLRLCWVLFKLFTNSWNIETLFAKTLKEKHSGGIKKMGAWLWLQSWIIPCWVYLCQLQFFIMLNEWGTKWGDETKGTTPACVIINQRTCNVLSMVYSADWATE